MGEYNPNSPYILGQEWAAVRNERIQIAPFTNLVEYGHQFTTQSDKVLNDSRFYVEDMPPSANGNPYYLTSIYKAGTEGETGPLRSVIIPVDSVSITGAAQASGSPPNGGTALLTPPLDYYYVLTSQSGSPFGLVAIMWISYNVNAYAQLLSGKRIVAVNTVWGASCPSPDLTPSIGITDDATTISKVRSAYWGLFSNISRQAFTSDLSRFSLGMVAPYPAGLSTNERLPWTYDDLARFDTSAASRTYVAVCVGVDFGDVPFESVEVWYSGLEVVYCEEKRLYVGGWAAVAGSNTIMNLGANVARMRSWQAKALNPVMPPDTYTVTLSSLPLIGRLSLGALDIGPYFNALRELKPGSHAGIQLDIPYPPENNLGKPFVAERSTIIPQLSLHTSGGSFTEPHVYGRIAAAQVWGTRTALQEIYDSFNTARDYSWIKFYARRFGHTEAALDVSGVGFTTGASIGVADFDALDEVTDGWKEVNLQLDPKPLLGDGTIVGPAISWSSSNTTPGNRWEILGVSAPALSGTAGNVYNPVVATHNLSQGTYYQGQGATQELTWMPQGVATPYVSGASADSHTDAVLIVGAQQPTITGFSVEVTSQPLTGVGLDDCGLSPCGVPTALSYNKLTWSPRGVTDSFTNRIVTGGWGTADSGQAWQSGAAFDVAGGVGTSSMSVVGTEYVSAIDPGLFDMEVEAEFTIPALALTQPISLSLIARYKDASNYYILEASLDTGGNVDLVLQRNVAGVFTVLASFANVCTYTPASPIKARFQVAGSLLRGKAWRNGIGSVEPEIWQISATDATFTGAGSAGVRASLITGNTNTLPFVTEWDNFNVKAPAFKAYEIQRMDSVDSWQTIAMATTSGLQEFNDYEARVALQSDYRIRIVDVHDFSGPWSSTVSATVTAPGVTAGCVGDGHVLTFTSNESQNGAHNLAYLPIWEGAVEESFTYDDTVTMTPMYGRDFVTAFRPQERTGDRFQRTLLVQAAAISPLSLGGFDSLRDLAWSDLPYVCVRDEDGNRWYATVLVPNGRVRNKRKLHLASVDIIEVTDTPSQVDP